jgi:hypothetical protein
LQAGIAGNGGKATAPNPTPEQGIGGAGGGIGITGTGGSVGFVPQGASLIELSAKDGSVTVGNGISSNGANGGDSTAKAGNGGDGKRAGGNAGTFAGTGGGAAGGTINLKAAAGQLNITGTVSANAGRGGSQTGITVGNGGNANPALINSVGGNGSVVSATGGGGNGGTITVTGGTITGSVNLGAGGPQYAGPLGTGGTGFKPGVPSTIAPAGAPGNPGQIITVGQESLTNSDDSDDSEFVVDTEFDETTSDELVLR